VTVIKGYTQYVGFIDKRRKGYKLLKIFKPKHVGAASLILKCFNNSTFLM
jgi:hypothetical protein